MGAGRESGMVTAETAVALPVLVLLLLVSLWAVTAVTLQLRAVDAARVAARELARGEPPGQALSAARQAAPPRSRVTVTSEGSLLTVRVRAPVRAPGPVARLLPALAVQARASALDEHAAARAAETGRAP